MPHQHTTPISLGDLGIDITHVKMSMRRQSSDDSDPLKGSFDLRMIYGTMSGSVFTTSPIQPPNVAGTLSAYKIEGADYTALIATIEGVTGTPVYQTVKEALYAHLVTKNAIPAGTLV